MGHSPRLLVLGGTHFVGRAVVDAALDAGWDVTALHRGHSPEPLPSGIRQVLGDRTDPATIAGLARAHPNGWDAVVDTWSADPWVVRDAARSLSDHALRYVYVSSRSVYDSPPANADESWPIVDADPNAGDPRAGDQAVDSTDADHRGASDPVAPLSFTVPYAEAKAGAERAVVEAFGDRGVLLRPGVVLGPREDIGRLPWWLTRMARGGQVLAPGPRGATIQMIDARDLAAFTLVAADGTPTPDNTGRGAPLSGPYDVVCPVGHATMGSFLDACLTTTRSEARLRWVEPQLVLDAGVAPWTELPMWLPPGEDHDALHGADVSRAIDAGLRCRPLIETVADTWAWLASFGGRAPQRADRPPLGLDPETEARVLAAL